MKFLFLFGIALLAVICVVTAEPGLSRDRPPAPYINRPKLPPVSSQRFRRSPKHHHHHHHHHHHNVQGTLNAEYHGALVQNKNGHINLDAGVQKTPGSKTQSHIGLEGAFRFKRSPEPEPQGSIVLQGQKPMSGPERRPTWNLDYQHKIYEGKNGHISASGGALKLPGQRVEPHVGIQGQIRFKRSPEPEPQGSIVLQGQKPMSGPERRPTWNLDYQHKIWQGKNGHISASGGALKLPGQRVEPHVGIQGQIRFKRSPEPEPQGSIVLQGQKPMSGPERRPTWNLDYQHKIWQGKNGHISASGGALKLPGQRVQPHVGIQGQIRF